MCRCAAAIARAVVAFLDAVLVGCFLSCFRPRPRIGTDPDSPGSGCRDPIVPKDRLGELLSASDDEEEDLGKDVRCNLLNFQDILHGLRYLFYYHLDSHGGPKSTQANYLKLCGTISETPAELRNVSYQINLENSDECDDIPTDALAMRGTSVSEFNSSEGFKCEEDHNLRLELNAEDTEYHLGVDSIPQSALQEKSPFWSIKNRLSDCSGSPFPTPLVLRDDMQTPGTIYTPHKGSSMSRKHVRTRKQFVYPVLRPIENKLQPMELTEDSSPMLPSNTPKWRNLAADPIKKLQQTSSNSMAEVGLSKSLPFSFSNDNASYQEKGTLSLDESKCQIGSPNMLDDRALSKSNSDEKHVALSLTRWLKPSSADGENQVDVKCPARDQLHDENTLFTGSPVLTASGMDWDVENPTPRLPKAWDGNGIPNTTTKYKEDQKVSWHATPFEERLLKVLSDEKPNPPRKLIRGNLFHVEET